MIGDWARLRSLRAILLLAFLLVAGSGVAVLGIASWLSASADSARHEQQEQAHAVAHVANEAASAYSASDGWRDADLSEARAVAQAAGGRLAVLDATGDAVHLPDRGPTGWVDRLGSAATAEASAAVISAPVVVAGGPVGSVAVRFGPRQEEIDPVSAGWIWLAAAAALVVALLAAVLLTRRLVLPLDRLITTARSFASGDRRARARIDAPGELGQLARDFDAMADEIQRTEERRIQTAADIAHELRTPLTVLQAGLEEVRDGLAPADGDTLARLHRQAVQLGRIVADLDELATSDESGQQVQFGSVHLDRIVMDEAESRRLLSVEAGITVSTDEVCPVVVSGDPDRLHQVVGNVLTNALNYCRRGDRVVLSCTAANGVGEFVCADTGPGIPPEELPRVFERSWRGGKGGKSGSGLGLAVAKKLAEANGGSISVRSDGRSGTSVRLRVPLMLGQ